MLEIKQIQQAEPELIEYLFLNAGMQVDRVNQKFFTDDRNILLAACITGEPAGFLYAYKLDRLNSTKPLMLLYSIDVFTPFRNQGIGRALIDMLKKMAVSGGCSEIFVLTNESNIASKKLYQKTGGVRENNDDVMYTYRL